MSYLTFQGNSEIWSHKTGGLFDMSYGVKCHLMNALWREIKIKATQYKLLVNRGGHYSSFDCIYT